MTETVWIINPYGSLPSESWATYRSTLLARCLAVHGYRVTQFISNFEHRSKSFRAQRDGVITVEDRYVIEVIPSAAYDAHISLGRIRYERTFARNLLNAIGARTRPDFIVLAEPSLFYYDILLRPLLRHPASVLVLDVIDLWPELFALVLPRLLRRWSRLLLSPLYFWRKRLYRHAAAVVAVAQDYLKVASRLTAGPDVPLEVVYWSYDEQRTATASAASPDIQQLVASKRPGEVWAVYAGTLGENYDIPAIVTLSQRLPAAVRDKVSLRFIVAGDGPLKQLCQDSVSASFIFAGRLAPEDLVLLYRYSDIALSTYRGESTVAMPIKAFEYLHSGLPIINSLGRDLGELIREHDIGINYDASDPSSLAEAVERLSCDAQLRRRLSANARRLAPSFSAARQYPKFVRVLERVAAQRLASTQ
jgi:glycosyltransferase involved in cell wall biosynthesis